MKFKLVLAVLLLAAVAQAKDNKPFQWGQLLRMDSVECGTPGTDSAHKKTQAPLCQEYLLQSEHVIYRIRPRDEKHTVLLPIGEKAQFRLEKDKMILRVEDLGDKDGEYSVVSMTARDDSKPSDNTASKLNHLQ